MDIRNMFKKKAFTLPVSDYDRGRLDAYRACKCAYCRFMTKSLVFSKRRYKVSQTISEL